MRKSGKAHQFATVVAVLGLTMPAAFAQDIQIMRDVGLTEDLPYTVFYPSVLNTVDDGNSQTIITLQPAGDKFLQCDVFAVSGAADGWTADSALSTLDVSGIEASWAPDFPGFRLTAQSTAAFASGPALRYEGQSDTSPMNLPITIIHAEAVDGGRTYAIECLFDRNIDGDARPVVDFIIANFSTKSDGQCCINPADDRG